MLFSFVFPFNVSYIGFLSGMENVYIKILSYQGYTKISYLNKFYSFPHCLQTRLFSIIFNRNIIDIEPLLQHLNSKCFTISANTLAAKIKLIK